MSYIPSTTEFHAQSHHCERFNGISVNWWSFIFLFFYFGTTSIRYLVAYGDVNSTPCISRVVIRHPRTCAHDRNQLRENFLMHTLREKLVWPQAWTFVFQSFRCAVLERAKQDTSAVDEVLWYPRSTVTSSQNVTGSWFFLAKLTVFSVLIPQCHSSVVSRVVPRRYVNWPLAIARDWKILCPIFHYKSCACDAATRQSPKRVKVTYVRSSNHSIRSFWNRKK